MSPKKRLYQIVAASPAYEDTAALLELLAEEAANINTPIAPADSLEIRKAINSYLKNAVDTLRRMHQNNKQGPSDVADDDPHQ